MTTIRQERLAGLLFEELSILVSSELNDPKLSLVQVTDVKVTQDLRTVKVYVMHSDENVKREEVLSRLRHAAPFLRSEIAVRCTLRAVPELLFYYDESPGRALRVDELLRRVAEERAARSAPPDLEK